jgi:hypothetical protein
MEEVFSPFGRGTRLSGRTVARRMVKRSEGSSGDGVPGTFAERRDGPRRNAERRGANRGNADRRLSDRRAGACAALAMASLMAMAPSVRADIYTRINSKGVVEATNLPANLKDFKLAYRSKGTLIHSSGFLLRPSTNNEFNAHIEDAATLFGVSRGLIRAIIQAESGFDRLAVSTAGARGLMQLMPATARRFGVIDSFNARQNIFAGTLYLRMLLNLYRGDISLSAAAYNAGEEAVARYNGIPPYKETQGYVRTVNGIIDAATEPVTPSPLPLPAPQAPAVPRIHYQWTDDNGVVHMAQSPPSAGKYSTIRSVN